MKKVYMSLSALCAACLLFCGTVMAAEPEVAEAYTGSVTVQETLKGTDMAYTVSRTSGVEAGQLYLVLLLKGNEDDTTDTAPLPDKDNIYYLNVKAAAGASVEFDVYPKAMEDGTYIVYLSDYSNNNAGAAKGVARIVLGENSNPDSTVIPGNVDGDDKGRVNNKDLTALIRYLNDWDEYQEGGEKAIDLKAADVYDDGKNKVNNKDLTALIRHLNEWDEYKVLPYTGK